jgi:molecular chaperone DnaK
LQEYGDKISADVKSDVEQKLAALREAREADDVSRITAAVQDLAQASQ